MKIRIAYENGNISEKMDVKQAAKEVVRETADMSNDAIILLYLVEEESNVLGKNIMGVHLLDNVLAVYDGISDLIATYDYEKVAAYALYKDMEKFLEEAFKQYEQEQFGKAEAEKASADYLLKIGRNNFRFKGESAAEMIYSVIKAFFNSFSRCDGEIIIANINTGEANMIEYSKGLVTASVKINGAQHKTFDYCFPLNNQKLQDYIRKEVIL